MAVEDKRSQKIYKGSYGDFLDKINAPPMAYEAEIMVALEANNGRMEMMELIKTVNGPPSEVMNTVYDLRKDYKVRVTTQNNQEFVELVVK